MPLQPCGAGGWRWGQAGKCYTGPDAKKRAIAQGLAEGNGTLKSTIRPVDIRKQLDRIQRAARAAKPNGEYGETLWNPQTQTVWWNPGWAAAHQDAYTKAVKVFLACPGVEDVIVGELPDEDGEWLTVQDGPAAKAVQKKKPPKKKQLEFLDNGMWGYKKEGDATAKPHTFSADEATGMCETCGKSDSAGTHTTDNEEQSTTAKAAAQIQKYSPDQERDERGRFGNGTGGSSAILSTDEKMNPANPEGAMYHDKGQTAHVVAMDSGSTRVVTTFGGGRAPEIGSRAEFHADQSGRHMGMGTLIGTHNFSTGAKEGHVPDKQLPHYVYKSKIVAGSGSKISKELFNRLWEIAGDALEEYTKASASDSPYGTVEYGDPGLQGDKLKRYPLDNERHIRASWGHINMEDNGAKYSADDLTKVRDKIAGAMKRIGADVTAA